MTIGQRTTTEVSVHALHQNAALLLANGCRLAAVAGYDDGDSLRVVYVFTSGSPDLRRELVVRLSVDNPVVPTLSDLSFSASRFERELHDNFAIVPLDHPFLRPLVRHQHWPDGWYPLREGVGAMPEARVDAEPYPFIQVAGSGVYEIPVGPVHAGMIEPGHFRFSVVGETILKMTARLWFVHRGIERMFQGASIDDGLEIAYRISGDTAVGHSLAYCLAVEEAMGIEVSNEAMALRSVLLEMERLYNHVGDIGGLCNDVSYGIANARALVIRERLLRINERMTGHRLLRGSISVGATSLRSLPSSTELIEIAESFDELVALARSNSTVVDRFEGTAALSATDALAIGTLGVLSRASGVRFDARESHSLFESDRQFVPVVHEGGDVMARFNQRVGEFHASLDIVRQLSGEALGLQERSATGRQPVNSGLGIVEGWRGTILHRIELGADGSISRARTIDPSFFNWPALSIALDDTIVPDFPLANKSFNLSYAGNDL
jgi:Ni,Fe-hydrogenase III large subunit/Ni,Fe-hydrogenase III component G